MTEGKEDPILPAPESGKDASAIPAPTTDPRQDDPISSTLESTSDDKKKAGPNYDERRLSLLNDPNYGVILCFLDKFRAHVDIQDYPLHLLEENLLSDEENISRRLIDFHLTLLKRISLGKGAKRDKFVSIISKFANRFDYMDGEYLQTNGYSQAQVDIKLRILKNLLETQFDHNPAFKTAFSEKQSFEIRSPPFGRDRTGASYWLFLDSECFIRLFRENYDDDRAWVNVCKDKDELEKFIELLITDHLIRKKFSEWKFTHEPFNALTVTHAFEERYHPVPIHVKKEEPKEIKTTKSSLPSLEPIKIENNLHGTSKKPFSLTIVKTELPPDHESTTSADKNGQRSRVESSNETHPVASSQEDKQEINNNQEDHKVKKSRRRRKSGKRAKKKRRTTSTPAKKIDVEQETVPKPTAKGKKRKQMADQEDPPLEKEKNDETSQDVHSVVMDEEFLNADNLPIALRRSRRTRKATTNELPPVTSTPTKSVPPTPTKKKLTNGKCKPSSQTSAKVSSQTPKTKAGRKRGRKRGGAGGKPSMNGMGSSSSDEHQPSEEDEDEYNSDDYLPDKKQTDELDEEDLLEVEEEDDEYVPRRSAKTVAKRHGQLNTEEQTTPSSACCVCAKTDRPEALLLCDDCDDAYHLECLKPALLSVPDGDWFCPMCEHKRFSENLIEKFIQLIKEYEELEVKRNQCMSKRTNRLANVMLNLDRMVKRSTKKRRPNGIVCSDDEEEEEEEEEKNKSEGEDDDDDDGSVYGFKDDGSFENGGRSKRNTTSSKRSARGERQKSSEPETLGVRSCRRKTQNYRFDDYDKKMKEAMFAAGVNGEEIEKDSDESEDEVEKKSAMKRGDYEKDDDFDTPGNKNDDEFAPDPDRSENSESEEADEEEFDDDESSDDGWKSKRRTAAKKKPTSKSNRRKSKKNSDDDDEEEEDEDETLSDADLDNLANLDTTKSDTNNDLDLNEDRRRSSRATTTRNYAKQEAGDSEDDDGEEDYGKSGRRPPPRRMRYKKRLGSDDSFVDDDDDYEKIARKREIVKYGKSVARSSITDHLKKLVDDEDGSAENKGSALPSEEATNNDQQADSTKRPQQNSDEPQPSDDDDFPDEQEIFKANGLLSLRKNLNGPPPAGFRPPFVAPTHSYQHAIVDPTARFTMIRPAVRPGNSNGYPSNGHDILEEK